MLPSSALRHDSDAPEGEPAPSPTALGHYHLQAFGSMVTLFWAILCRGLWHQPEVWARVGGGGRSVMRWVSEKFAVVVHKVPLARRNAEHAATLLSETMSPSLREGITTLRHRKASKDGASPVAAAGTGQNRLLLQGGSDHLGIPHSPLVHRDSAPDSLMVSDVLIPTPRMKKEENPNVKLEDLSDENFSPPRSSTPLITIECSSPRILSSQNAISLVNFLVILSVMVIFRTFLNVATMYHFIRSQSLLKLYVVYNMLEIIDRMWRSLERDVLDDLRLQTDHLFTCGPGGFDSPEDVNTTTVTSTDTDEESLIGRSWAEIWNDRYVRFARRFLVSHSEWAFQYHNRVMSDGRWVRDSTYSGSSEPWLAALHCNECTGVGNVLATGIEQFRGDQIYSFQEANSPITVADRLF